MRARTCVNGARTHAGIAAAPTSAQRTSKGARRDATPAHEQRIACARSPPPPPSPPPATLPNNYSDNQTVMRYFRQPRWSLPPIQIHLQMRTQVQIRNCIRECARAYPVVVAPRAEGRQQRGQRHEQPSLGRARGGEEGLEPAQHTSIKRRAPGRALLDRPRTHGHGDKNLAPATPPPPTHTHTHAHTHPTTSPPRNPRNASVTPEATSKSCACDGRQTRDSHVEGPTQIANHGHVRNLVFGIWILRNAPRHAREKYGNAYLTVPRACAAQRRIGLQRRRFGGGPHRTGVKRQSPAAQLRCHSACWVHARTFCNKQHGPSQPIGWFPSNTHSPNACPDLATHSANPAHDRAQQNGSPKRTPPPPSPDIGNANDSTRECTSPSPRANAYRHRHARMHIAIGTRECISPSADANAYRHRRAPGSPPRARRPRSRRPSAGQRSARRACPRVACAASGPRLGRPPPPHQHAHTRSRVTQTNQNRINQNRPKSYQAVSNRYMSRQISPDQIKQSSQSNPEQYESIENTTRRARLHSARGCAHQSKPNRVNHATITAQPACTR